jgi:Flp pilus assembly protein TadD
MATRTKDAAAARAKMTQEAAREQFGPALRLARASRANGDLASAINLYASVVAIKPADPAILLELGDTLVDAGSIDDAIDVYRKIQPSSTAWLGSQLGLEQAQVSYRAVLAIAPHNVAARSDLALSLALTGQFDEAVDLTSMARPSTATPRVRQNLALIYGLAGDAAQAGALSRVDLDSTMTLGSSRSYSFFMTT